MSVKAHQIWEEKKMEKTSHIYQIKFKLLFITWVLLYNLLPVFLHRLKGLLLNVSFVFSSFTDAKCLSGVGDTYVWISL